MDANEAKWDAASNEVALGWSTMPGWVLGSYSKRSSAAFMQEHGKLPPTQPRSSQKTHTIRQPKGTRGSESLFTVLALGTKLLISVPT